MSHRKIKKIVLKEMGKNFLGVSTGLELEISLSQPLRLGETHTHTQKYTHTYEYIFIFQYGSEFLLMMVVMRNMIITVATLLTKKTFIVLYIPFAVLSQEHR